MLCLTKYTVSGPSSRYRVHQFLPYLEKAGIDVDVQSLHDEGYLGHMFGGERPSTAYLLRRGVRRLLKLMAAPHYDLIFIQKEIFPSLPSVAEWLLGVSGAKLVVDIDDAIFTLYDNKSGIMSRALRRKFPSLLGRAALVLAGNDYLKSYAERYADNVVFFPTVVDEQRFVRRRERERSAVPVCGWIGSPATAGYLRPLAPTLQRLAKRERFRLKLIGGGSLDLEGVPVDAKSWSEAEEVDDLDAVDIGLMPLDSSEWSKGKCALKLLQYMSMAIPSVASPTGGAAEIITDGVNGYLAETPDEWHDKLLRLVRDGELRRTMGERARSWIEENYCLRRYGPIMVTRLMAVVQS
jgi:glycosyltransferase involved in cell wall biosynthesis